jgi:hypothetical protein
LKEELQIMWYKVRLLQMPEKIKAAKIDRKQYIDKA